MPLVLSHFAHWPIISLRLIEHQRCTRARAKLPPQKQHEKTDRSVDQAQTPIVVSQAGF